MNYVKLTSKGISKIPKTLTTWLMDDPHVFILENNRSDTVRDKMNLVAARSRNSEVLNRILLRNLDLTQTVFTRSV